MKNLLIAFTLLASASSFAQQIDVRGRTLLDVLDFATCDFVVQKPILIPERDCRGEAGSLVIYIEGENSVKRTIAKGKKLRIERYKYFDGHGRLLFNGHEVGEVLDLDSRNLPSVLISDIHIFWQKDGTGVISFF